MLDPEALAECIAEIVVETTSPLLARISELEKQLAERPAGVTEDRVLEIVGELPKPLDIEGVKLIASEYFEVNVPTVFTEVIKSVEPRLAALAERPLGLTEEEVRTIVGEHVEPVTKEIVSDMIADAVGAIPPVEVPTIDEDAIAERVKALVLPVVDEAVQAIPVPQDGKSVDMEEVRALLSDMTAETVAKAVEALPTPEDGKPGVGYVKLFIDRDGVLHATRSDGVVEEVGKVTGEDGKPGTNGFQLEDFDVEATEDPRTMVLTFAQGDVKYRYEIDLPIPLYRSVWKEGETYVRGDMCTWAGSLWHCDVGGTKSKPDAGDWTLCVKRGRDGKDAK